MDIVKLLNENQGVIAITSVVITIFGFFITNKHITSIKQSFRSGDDSQNNQAGRDIKQSQTQKGGNNSRNYQSMK